jgi:adenylyltransferase/sulfurtransferase
VLGVLPGLVGTLQATEALKWILGIGEPLVGRLVLVDALGARWRTVKVTRNPLCPACGTRTLTELVDYNQFCGVPVTPAPSSVPEVTPREVADRLAQGDDLVLLDVREPHEVRIAPYPNATLVPLGSLGDHLAEFPYDRDIIVACRSGARSARAVQQLQAAGFVRVWNLAGGILRWSDEVDPTIVKY